MRKLIFDWLCDRHAEITPQNPFATRKIEMDTLLVILFLLSPVLVPTVMVVSAAATFRQKDVR